jgi:hypothetical protein
MGKTTIPKTIAQTPAAAAITIAIPIPTRIAPLSDLLLIYGSLLQQQKQHKR